MSAVLEAEPHTPRLTEEDDQRLSIFANWDRYEQFLLAHGADYHRLRLTYDRGRLEFMSISSKHDKSRYLLGRIVDTVTEELSILVVGQGETTIRRKDLDRGFEPDLWYYIQRAAEMHGIERELDFDIDPAPDLAIEIEITRSLLDRIGLYAAVGVREIWRSDGATIRILVLQADRTYKEIHTSLAIPWLTVEVLNRILSEAKQENPTIYFRQLRTKLREQLRSAATNEGTPGT